MDGAADIVYATEAPESGLWIPAQPDAQDFFRGEQAFPGTSVHRHRGLTLLWEPVQPAAAIPGDILASAFYLLARWDELRVPERDRFDRLPARRHPRSRTSPDSISRIRPSRATSPRSGRGWASRRPATWSVYLTHDIDRLRRRTPRGIASEVRAGGIGRLRRRWRGGIRGTTFPTFSGPAGGVAWRRRCSSSGATPTNSTAARARSTSASGLIWCAPCRPPAARSASTVPSPRARIGERSLTSSPSCAARPAAVRGRPLPLPALPLPRDRALAGGARPGVRREPRLQRGAGLRLRDRPAVPAMARRRGAGRRPAARAAGGHGHDPALVPRARRRRRPRARARACSTGFVRAGGAAALLWHNTYLADARAPGYGTALGGPDRPPRRGRRPARADPVAARGRPRVPTSDRAPGRCT